jgi:uncharacterized repeat protein (TIGR02543 family)
VQWERPVGTPYNFATPVTENITLTAKWVLSDYTITFNPQGGTVSPTSKPVTYNSAVGNLPEPTKAGYEFSGWASAASSGTTYTPNTVYLATENITLYAQWTAKQYTIYFIATDGTVDPASMSATFNSAVGTLPVPTRNIHEFKGWFRNPDGSGTQVTANTVYEIDGNITLYAKWEFIQGTKPTAEMLNYTLPTGLIYNGLPIAPITANQKAEVIRTLGAITILYDGNSTPPKNAGTHNIYAFIAKSTDYDSATVLLGSIRIAKANITLNVLSATALSKEYDATTEAVILRVDFDETLLLASDAVSQSDYSYEANYISPNVGTGIEINGTVIWLTNGPLSTNYNLASPPFTTNANITIANGVLIIAPPEAYKLTNTSEPTIISKSSFIPDSEIIWEYRKDGETAYSEIPPDRIGAWVIRASFATTANYTGAVDSAIFLVTRGNAATVRKTIKFEEGFTHELSFSRSLQDYFVAGSSLCEITSTRVKIMMNEKDITLSLNSIPQRGDIDDDGFSFFELPFSFGKPGLDTLVYELFSRDGIYSEEDTIIVETPIPFESVAKEKWGNVLLINNNPRTNGGYDFADFTWFKNNEEVSNLQFYSAGPSSKDILDPKDVYKATMHTTSGMRISTCEANPKEISQPATKPGIKKQVLGINGKAAKSNAKIYNIHGSQVQETPAGVYLIEEK